MIKISVQITEKCLVLQLYKCHGWRLVTFPLNEPSKMLLLGLQSNRLVSVLWLTITLQLNLTFVKPPSRRGESFGFAMPVSLSIFSSQI